jgi:thymidylate synthase
MSDIYLPYNKRVPDFQYQDALKLILERGMRSEAPSGVDTITYPGIQMRFRPENGCPLITERDMAPKRKTVPTVWQQAIGELTGFINGARTHEDLVGFGCHWWKHFLTDKKCIKRGLEPGDNGPGSYGAAFHDFPTAEGETFDQFENLLKQMKFRPYLKTHLISPWIPQYTFRHEDVDQKVVVCPCHGWLQFMIFGDKLVMHMKQRSGDFPIGIPSNMIQYFALFLAVAKHLNLVPHEFIHYVVNAHIYENQIEGVRELVKRIPRPFPALVLNSDVEDMFALRYTDFELEDYNPHPDFKFDVTV